MFASLLSRSMCELCRLKAGRLGLKAGRLGRGQALSLPYFVVWIWVHRMPMFVHSFVRSFKYLLHTLGRTLTRHRTRVQRMQK